MGLGYPQEFNSFKTNAL
ncbi:hypothetical protein AVEN_198169-1, partial [Araneus ventricosus]